MAYKALYRTYRPQTFEEVVGQQHIIKTLKNALEKNKIAHAYLFCGPRGTGKTTMAKLFAKALNCEEGIGHQCNKCENCIEVTNGTHPDVIEIDAASNNGVEQVRDLIDKVNYLPIKGKYKVYIIDEVHMMTDNAFNALLKTLEEPPSHVIFILATTEPHNILPTIVSRCQRYDFTKVSDPDIYKRLTEVLEKEGTAYTKKGIEAIISLADGGMRDALSILDQVLAYSGNTLREEDVNDLFGITSNLEKINFLKAITNGDVATCLNKINLFSEKGIDLKRLTSDLLDILKDVLIIKKTKDENQLTKLNENEALDLANALDMYSLNEMISAFLKAQIDYKTVNNIKTMFEVVVLKLCTSKDIYEEKIIAKPRQETIKPVEQKEIKEVEEPKPIIKEIKEEPKPTKIEPIKEEIKEDTPPDWLFEDDSTEKKEVREEGEMVKLDDETVIKLMVLGDKQERKTLMNRWNELDSYLYHPIFGDIIALIKDGKPYLVTKEAIILEYDLQKLANKLNVKENQKNASEVFSHMLNKDIFVYALSRNDSVRLYKSYINLKQISKLPRAKEININLKEFL